MAEPTTTAAAAAPKPAPQKPSLGRIVIVHSEHHVDAPGIITAVHENGSVDVQVFRGDHMTHSELKLEGGDESGAVPAGGHWSWPARV